MSRRSSRAVPRTTDGWLVSSGRRFPHLCGRLQTFRESRSPHGVRWPDLPLSTVRVRLTCRHVAAGPYRAGIQGFKPETKRALPERLLHRDPFRRTSLGCSCPPGIDWSILLRISPLAPLSLLVVPHRPMPEPQGIEESSSDGGALRSVPSRPPGLFSLLPRVLAAISEEVVASQAGCRVHW